MEYMGCFVVVRGTRGPPPGSWPAERPELWPGRAGELAGSKEKSGPDNGHLEIPQDKSEKGFLRLVSSRTDLQEG